MKAEPKARCNSSWHNRSGQGLSEIQKGVIAAAIHTQGLALQLTAGRLYSCRLDLVRRGNPRDHRIDSSEGV